MRIFFFTFYNIACLIFILKNLTFKFLVFISVLNVCLAAIAIQWLFLKMLRVVTWGKQQILFIQSPYKTPSIFGDRMPLSSEYRESTSHTRVLWPASGEARKIFPVSTISQSPSTWNIQYARMPYFGVACPQLHQMWNKKL